MKLGNPRDLLLRLLGDLLFVERRLADEILPKLRESADDEELRAALAEHLEQTRAHAGNVERAFRLLRAEPSPMRSPALEGLQAQHEAIAESIVPPALSDLFAAGSAAHGEHYELGAYSAAIALARALGEEEAAGLLTANHDDETAALERLERLVERLAAAAVEASRQP